LHGGTLAALSSPDMFVQTTTATIPPPAAVRALLDSPSLKDQAWGAWWAAEGNMRELEPQLRRNLETELAADFQNPIVLDDTLAAFIRFGEDSLPVSLLQTAYDAGRQPAALILLAEPSRPRAEVDRFLLAIVARKDGSWMRMNWLAAADLLLSHQTPGLVAAVLQDLKFTAHALICHDVQNCARMGQGIGVSWSHGAPDSTWPLWVHYQLMAPGSTGTVLVQGRSSATTMAYGRYTGEALPPSSPSPLTPAERLVIVAAAAPQVQLPTIDGETLKIAERPDGAYDRDVESFRQDLVRRYGSMIQALRDVGALSADEVTALATPSLDVVVEAR